MKKAHEAEWQTAWFIGQECLFSEDRVERDSVPGEFFCYELRHGDDPGVPCTAEDFVRVNFYGTLLTSDNLPISPDGCFELMTDDLIVSDKAITLSEWQADIEAQKAGPPTEWIRVLIVEPMKAPRVDEIPHTLSGMQAVVGGTIRALYPSRTDKVAFIHNDDGKLIGLQPNRILRDECGSPYDYIAGTFFVCGLGDEDFASLPPDMEKKYLELFRGEMLMPEPSKPKRRRPKAPER